MYKMLIVEDEDIEREGLTHYIDWASMDIEVMGAVESGEEALEYALKQKVDILFTDIRLLGITGLELAKKMILIYPNLKVVISSGYQDFEYAREAVELQAFAFLTKPVDMGDLEKVFKKIVNQCRIEEKELFEKEKLTALLEENMPLLKNRFFNDLIKGRLSQGNITKTLNYLGVCIEGICFNTLVWEIDNFDMLASRLTPQETNLNVMQVLDIIGNGNNYTNVLSFHINRGLYCSIIGFESDNKEALYERTLDYAQETQKKVNCTCELDLTIGIGQEVNSLMELQISYQYACNALDLKFFMGNNQIIHYNDIHLNLNQNTGEGLEKEIDKIVAATRVSDKGKVEQSLNRFFVQLEYGRFSDVYIRGICANLLSKTSVMLLDMNESYEKVFGSELGVWGHLLKLDTLWDMKKWIHEVFDRINEYLIEKKEGSNRRVIDDIIKYIGENYQKNITISDISREIYFSPNYIGIIFKKEIGESFTDYLIKFRLQKALELMEDNSLKVYEIGDRVGYPNTSYFCSLFKKTYGVSPNEYREAL